MPKVTSLGHMGFHVRDMERSVAFYRDVLGLNVSDRSPRGAVFLTSQDRRAEHHELYLAPGRDDEGKVNVIQQISFRCPTFKDVKDFYQLFVDTRCRSTAASATATPSASTPATPMATRWKSTGRAASTYRNLSANRWTSPKAKWKSANNSIRSSKSGKAKRQKTSGLE